MSLSYTSNEIESEADLSALDSSPSSSALHLLLGPTITGSTVSLYHLDSALVLLARSSPGVQQIGDFYFFFTSAIRQVLFDNLAAWGSKTTPSTAEEALAYFGPLRLVHGDVIEARRSTCAHSFPALTAALARPVLSTLDTPMAVFLNATGKTVVFFSLRMAVNAPPAEVLVPAPPLPVVVPGAPVPVPVPTLPPPPPLRPWSAADIICSARVIIFFKGELDFPLATAHFVQGMDTTALIYPCMRNQLELAAGLDIIKRLFPVEGPSLLATFSHRVLLRLESLNAIYGYGALDMEPCELVAAFATVYSSDRLTAIVTLGADAERSAGRPSGEAALSSAVMLSVAWQETISSKGSDNALFYAAAMFAPVLPQLISRLARSGEAHGALSDCSVNIGKAHAVSLLNATTLSSFSGLAAIIAPLGVFSAGMTTPKDTDLATSHMHMYYL
ncbi:hypothetical protein T492DRAFT_853763 [Pavlovales sp. CCMP2436]|nr:hypothetical protein T492DRAFT_853763 [Pavlovales sp. CCMP2436]